MVQKNPILGLIIGIIPGMGHFYLKRIRAALYFFCFMAPFMFGLGIGLWNGGVELITLSGVVWLISIVDLIITWNKQLKINAAATIETADDGGVKTNHSRTIMLAFVPGCGHLHLGLANRGLTFLAAFFGLASMIFFVTIWTNHEGFLIFLFIIPVIWIYNMFDIVKLQKLNDLGLPLVDQSLFEDLEQVRKDGGKNKIFATILAIFPGTAHLYLGLQRRGLQLMAAFLFTIFILDVLRFDLFFFLAPIIWFYSFFDALQQINKDPDDLEDKPVVEYLIYHQRWVGIGLIALGMFYIFDRVLVPIADRFLVRYYNIQSLYMYYHEYFQTGIVAFLLILGGIKLLMGTKKKLSGGKV
ncbi:hypothetical protein KUV80_14010 [Fictibacillus nanhaiensis]|uniref:hypothetical protein n=1 Tax=Fictibacillus nanhaiensis TaxID=742169 RepID=UPI001C970E9B|nr:hypothetical protein [Fictibacillus nanhaiensis]MBY6037782.1 hypothetical protein [Fictibacillus nanhaiensis]